MAPTDMSAITVHISREEILQDIYSLMEDMSRIRNKCLNERVVEDEDIKEYLGLTSLLSSAFMGISDKHTLDKLGKLVSFMNKDERLLEFDPVQRRYWERRNPEFLSISDTVLIQLYGDNFNSLDKSHHLMSALKYACAKNEQSEDDMRRITGSILPVNGPVKTDNPSELFYHHKLTREENPVNLTFDMSSVYEMLRNSIITARELGFLSIKVELDKENYSAIVNEFSELIPTEVRKQGIGRQRIIVEIPVNKAPSETQNITGRIKEFFMNQDILELTEYEPGSSVYLMFGFQAQKIMSRFTAEMQSQLSSVNPSSLTPQSSIMGLVSQYRDIWREIYGNPDRFGYQKGDRVIGNKNIATEKDADDNLWVGSIGDIIGVSDSEYVIRFNDPIYRKSNSKKECCEVIDRAYLKKTKSATTPLPRWFQKNGLVPGDIVKLNSSYANDNDIEKGDLDSGSVGVVVGPSYKILFSKVIDKEGRIKDLVNNHSTIEEGIMHHCIDRVDASSEDTIEKKIKDALIDAIKRSSEIKIDVKTIKSSKHGMPAYVHEEDIDAYRKTSVVLQENNISYLLCYIAEKQERSAMPIYKKVFRKADKKFGEKEIVDYLLSYRGASADAFRHIANSLEPIYISMYVYKDLKQINFFEATR